MGTNKEQLVYEVEYKGVPECLRNSIYSRKFNEIDYGTILTTTKRGDPVGAIVPVNGKMVYRPFKTGDKSAASKS